MTDSFSQSVQQLENVLNSNPGDVLDFAIKLRDSGVSKEELTRVFDAVRSRHTDDQDGTKYDAILNTMDRITGWCSRRDALFPEEKVSVRNGHR